jgi:general secretion pathway protein D
LTTGTTTGTSSGNSILLSKTGHISTSDYSISLPGALIQALLSDASTRVLQRPQVRVTDGGKASLKIGSKIPYVSGSLNSAVATPGAIPYATTQFQEVDVGVNVDLEPKVNGPEDVSMHIKVEISNVTSTETIAGVQQPIIGQRVNEANIRMKDGEVSVLGGLSLVNDQNSISGIPGITNIPVLGYLFGTRSKFHENDDILIALIPHIVRAPDLTVIGEDGVVAGTERVIRVRRRPEGSPAGSTPNSPAQPNPLPPAAAPPSTPTPNPPSQTSPSGNPAALPPPPPRVPPNTAAGQPHP